MTLALILISLFISFLTILGVRSHNKHNLFMATDGAELAAFFCCMIPVVNVVLLIMAIYGLMRLPSLANIFKAIMIPNKSKSK